MPDWSGLPAPWQPVEWIEVPAVEAFPGADIEMIAGMLIERGTLTGEEVDAALPPGFMARPVTLEIALAADLESGGTPVEAVSA